MIKMCSIRSIDKKDSVIIALNERPDNLINKKAFVDNSYQEQQSQIQNQSSTPAMALVIGKLWRNGRTLRIAFMDNPHPLVKAKVIQYASQWLEYANLSFAFIDGIDGDIRISFNTAEGSYSYVGTDALGVPAGEATMNYGWLTADTDEAEFRRVILHEFGHALGAEHEHQHPFSGIPWNKEKVYAHYAQTNNWDRNYIDDNVFAKYSLDQINTNGYDPDSIMHYAVDGELTDHCWQTEWNSELSSKDMDLMRKCYPKNVQTT